MFEIGEVVSYGTTGICTVEEIRMESVSRSGIKKQPFYILRPASTPSCVTMVPVSNEQLTGKMRRVLKKPEIDAMIARVRGQCLPWIEDSRQRAEAYSLILSKGITEELLLLIASLYQEKRRRTEDGRRFGLTDERLLSSAARMVSEEFSYALSIPKSKVTAYIAEKMNG